MSDTPETDKYCGEDLWIGEPALVSSDFARKLERERDEAREVADNLVEYAHECLIKLESWGKGYERYESEMQTIREAIAAHAKLKEAVK